jgi:hypothetical protein
MVTNRQVFVDIDLVQYKTFSTLYFKDEINFVAGCESWLGRYDEYGSYLAMFHTYLENPMT